jgi:DNA recombination-dependent growth factor C
MPLTGGSVTMRAWRVADALPPNFKESFERNLKRHAFRPIDPERGELQSLGWVNARQMLDSNLNLDKVLFGNVILAGLRVDRLVINMKLFRATVAQEVAKALREARRPKLSREERLVIEDKARLELLKRAQPSVNVYEMAWHLQDGIVFFATSSQKMAMIFSDLFSETFQVSIEQQLPFLRAQAWADRQKLGQELLELLPSPFSPDAPREVIEASPRGEDD